jgi:hypothetical protein
MTELIADLELAWRRMWASPGTATAILPLLVLGIALNAIALNVVEDLRMAMRGGGESQVTCVARSEARAIRTVVVLALKKIGGGQREWCSTRQMVIDRRTDVAQGSAGIGCGIRRASRAASRD